MSIAICALVRPSRLLRAAQACLGLLLVAGGVMSWHLLHSSPSHVMPLLPGICLAGGFGGIFRALAPGKSFQLDISGIGQLRLKDDYGGTHADSRHRQMDMTGEWRLMKLHSDTTLWSWLLLLHLQGPDGERVVLPVFRDSVREDEFRGVAVACHWIAAHNNRAIGKAV